MPGPWVHHNRHAARKAQPYPGDGGRERSSFRAAPHNLENVHEDLRAGRDARLVVRAPGPGTNGAGALVLSLPPLFFGPAQRRCT